MSAIEDRIAAVLEKHKSWDGGFTWSCHCGVDFHDEDDHASHVAAAVVAELQLTEEWAFEFTEPLSGDRKHYPLTEAAARKHAAEAQTNRDAAALSRWVTGWEKAE